MTSNSFPPVELIVDVLSLYHAGEKYGVYATEPVRREVNHINARVRELVKQDMPGFAAVRQAKIEWLLGHTPPQRVPRLQVQVIGQNDPARIVYLFDTLAAPTIGEKLTIYAADGNIAISGQ